MQNKKIIIVSWIILSVFLCACGETPETVPALPAVSGTCTVTYRSEGETICAETVRRGDTTGEAPEEWEGRNILSWRLGQAVLSPEDMPVTEDLVLEAVFGPELRREGGYMAAESDGLFHPLDPFTRGDAVRAVYALLAEPPEGEVFLKDVTARAECYTAASALASEGYVALDAAGRFYPDAPITRKDLTALLSRVFAPAVVRRALETEEEPLTRGRAASIFNALLGLSEADSGSWYPDVSPEDALYAAVETAGGAPSALWERTPGFVLKNGALYNMEESGYLTRDAMVGTLYFDASGRYTSGDAALDAFVTQIIRTQTRDTMTREERLRVLYDYVRDHFLYLKRNTYAPGETGWEREEALTMFQTGKGNCYNFASAFAALARGIGYDAVCRSGRIGVKKDAHSWVEIGESIYDPETEMSYRLQGGYVDLFGLSPEEGEAWHYDKSTA